MKARNEVSRSELVKLQAKAMSEAELQREVIRLLRSYGYLVTHIRPALTGRAAWTTPIEGQPGFPDIVACRIWPTGRVLFIELKREGKHLTAPQREWFRYLSACEGEAVKSYVFRPMDLLDGTIRKALR